MTDDTAPTDRRTLLRNAGLLAAGGIAATGSASAAECFETQFGVPSEHDSSDPEECTGAHNILVPPGEYGRVSTYCGDYDQYAWFVALDNPQYTGWVHSGALVPCQP